MDKSFGGFVDPVVRLVEINMHSRGCNMCVAMGIPLGRYCMYHLNLPVPVP